LDGKENGLVNKLIKDKDELKQVLSTLLDSDIGIDDEAYEIRENIETDNGKIFVKIYF